MALRVIRIPEEPADNENRRRAAAYARVSTDHSDQLTSYAAQVDYYTRYIQSREDLEFVRVYTDEGISGTSTARRTGFKQMIADALAGEIDLIITKSVSRFARNTVDGLSAIRLLKENNVECYFEKENIHTFDSKGELLLTIMSGIAQEESRSISENCVWGQRKRFSDGKVTVPFKRFLGYDRGEDGSLVVNKEQAQIVREIYHLFIDGASPYRIAKLLTEWGIPSPGGKRSWNKATVTSILSNEKYKGDALLQKAYTTDFLTKRKKLNRGKLPQYYVEGDHEPIISEELFELAQKELERRRLKRRKELPKKENDIFSPKLICPKCGEHFAAKVWHSTHNYQKKIWRCAACEKEPGSLHLTDTEIKQIFIKAVNALLPDKEAVIRRSAEFTKRLGNTRDPINKPRFGQLVDDPQAIAAAKAVEELRAIKFKHRIFRKDLKALTEPVTKFDERSWNELMDHAECFDDRGIRAVFTDGTEISIKI